MSNPVEKGKAYEEQVVEYLNTHGLDAHRTNVTNPDDPVEYKHGFDGGVDIIAKYSSDTNVKRDLTFYIQCKDHKNEIPKSAISEVFAGMHARRNYNRLCCPVVISTSTASQETIQFAKSLGVELILANEWNTLQFITQTKHANYTNYGPLMKVIIHNLTNDPIWIDTLPEVGNPLSDVAIREKLLKQTEDDYDKVQSYFDTADDLERKAREARQKAIDIQKIAAIRALKSRNFSDKDTETEKESKAEKSDKESG